MVCFTQLFRSDYARVYIISLTASIFKEVHYWEVFAHYIQYKNAGASQTACNMEASVIAKCPLGEVSLYIVIKNLQEISE